MSKENGQGSGWRRREPRETRRGVTELFQGMNDIQIHFDPPFEGDPPTHVMTQMQIEESLGANGHWTESEDVPYVVRESITTNGFRVMFKETLDGGGRYLAWEAF